ncbi:alanine:cation symporter family protein, partial [Planococcus sp. SIMBA_143]
KNEEGEWVGGPQYYIRKALGWKTIAILFAVFLMLEAIPSVMVQSNSIATQLQGAFNWPVQATGIGVLLVIGIIIIGGIKRIANVTDKLVPFMVLAYLTLALIVIIANADQLGTVFSLIFTHAFTPISATGGFAGA